MAAADYIYAAGAGRRTDVSVANTSLHGGAARVTLWFYANTGSATRLKVEAVQATTVLASSIVAQSSGFGWRSVSSPMLQGLNEIGLQDLRLRFTTLDGGNSNVRAAYVQAVFDPCAPEYGKFGPGQWPSACWRPYGTTSPFNRKLPSNPRLIHGSQAASAAIVGRVIGDISQRDHPNNLASHPRGIFGEPTYYPDAGDPMYTLRCDPPPGWGPCSIEGHQVRIPAAAAPEGGWGAAPADDRHMAIIDQTSGWEYNLWQVRGTGPLPPNGGTLTFTFGGRSRIVGDCAGLAADGTNCETTTPGHGTAAHFAGLAGRVRAEELQAGRIDHALNITINCDSGQAVYPARHAGRSCSEIPLSNLDAPPMGALFQLGMSVAEIDALDPQKVKPWHKVFLRAMAEYGMYLGDTGSEGLFSIETEAGNQYLTVGHADPWRTYGQANWEPWTHDGITEYVGKFFAPRDPDPDLWWKNNIWSHLRVLDPCVAAMTC
ncbi:hypothetical protein ABZ345_32490 [Lentzea sp. NPDC005914]|uniref:hypothetical protein n=1 Tax=Lentzea sp. NPDC005914 TaxID=3154572 RepID=UPI0034106F71